MVDCRVGEAACSLVLRIPIFNRGALGKRNPNNRVERENSIASAIFAIPHERVDKNKVALCIEVSRSPVLV